jgi:DHA2 family multidrug resistance protein
MASFAAPRPAVAPSPRKPANDDSTVNGVPIILITLTTMLGLIMAIIDTSIVNVALSDMGGTLGASIDEVGWVATGYILATVIVMPLNGWLTARFGRRNFYAACIVIFTVASFLCGTATSIWQLVFYRVIQGFGGGALQPTAQAILFESYPPAKRNSAMAIFGLGAMVGPAIGPTLGGVIVDNYSWPLIFYINIPIGILAFVMTMAFIKDQTYVKRDTSPIDWLGLAMLTAGVSSLQFVLERGQREDWFSSQTICIMTAVAVCSLVAFIVRELRDPKPLVDLSVFKSRSFSAGCTIGIVTGFGLFGTSLMIPLYFQNVLGFDATTTGFALLPGAIATAVSMPLASMFVKRVDSRISIAMGLALFAVGCWMMGGLNGQADFADTMTPRIIQGLALGFLFVPLTTLTLSSVSREKMSGATGVYTLIRQLGGSLGIAILQFYETRREDSAYASLATGMTQGNEALANLLHGAASQSQMLNDTYQMVVANARAVAYNDVFRLCAIVFIVSLPTIFLLGKAQVAKGAPPVAAAE